MAVRKRGPVSGSFKVPISKGVPKFLGRDEHHLGWDRALQDALDKLGWPPGRYENAHIQYSANIDVKNPGSVIEYIVTII